MTLYFHQMKVKCHTHDRISFDELMKYPLSPVQGHGWTTTDGKLRPIWFQGPLIPVNIALEDDRLANWWRYHESLWNVICSILLFWCIVENLPGSWSWWYYPISWQQVWSYHSGSVFFILSVHIILVWHKVVSSGNQFFMLEINVLKRSSLVKKCLNRQTLRGENMKYYTKPCHTDDIVSITQGHTILMYIKMMVIYYSQTVGNSMWC